MINTELFRTYYQTLKAENRNITVYLDEPMSAHTSFQIGGKAGAMVVPQTADEVILAIKTARDMGIETEIIGRGTNLLVTDEPINKVFIETYQGLNDIQMMSDGNIYAESGVPLSRIAVAAMNNGLTGFEFAHGIPGSLGGAVYMNAGAYGGEMKDVIVKTTYLDDNCTVRTLTGDDHLFGYRKSFFSNKSGYIILSSEIRLQPGNMFAVMKKMKELAEKRRTSQPLDLPSAGSTFKRPQSGFAAAMIDEAGLKGKGVGGACVSEKHAGFIVNKGGATFDDVIKTMELVRNTVYEKTGVMLEPEVKIIR